MRSFHAPTLTAALLAVVTPIAAIARDQTPASPPAVVAAPAAPPAGGCELHVWPAERFAAITTGWLGGGLLDVAVHADGDRQRKTAIASALDSEGQVAALGSLDLVALLGQAPATVIRHDEPLTRHTVNDIKTRRAQSSSPCYAELIVADIFYQRTAIYGRSLRGLFIYREFGGSQTATRIYKGWGGNGLKIFPAKPGEDSQAADAELVGVFKADFQEFARNEVAARAASH